VLRGFLRLVVCVCVAWLVPGGCGGQEVVWKDSVRLPGLQQHIRSSLPLLKLRISTEVSYSMTFSTLLFLNWQREKNANQFALLHNLRYRSTLGNGRGFLLTTVITHNLGLQCFFDSITRFQPDENIIDSRLDFRITRHLSWSLVSNVSTRLFNGYDYQVNDSGMTVRTLNSSFLTPLFWMLSTGFTVTMTNFGSLSFGLTGGKLTYVHNRRIYDAGGPDPFFGVPGSKGYLLEYGWSLHLLIDRDIFSRVHWNCDLLLFKNLNNAPDLAIRNLFSIRINKFLKASMQTRLYYEEQVSRRIQLENLVSVGFWFLL
jgi:hypothetical protein